MEHYSSTSSLHWVFFRLSKLHWQCPVLPVWYCHWVWQWMRTYLSMNVQKKSFAQVKVWKKHLPTVTPTHSRLFSTLTWHLSSQVSSCLTLVLVRFVVLLRLWLSVFLYPSLLLYSWLVWFMNTSWVKISGWTWHSQPRSQRIWWPIHISILWVQTKNPLLSSVQSSLFVSVHLPSVVWVRVLTSPVDVTLRYNLRIL